MPSWNEANRGYTPVNKLKKNNFLLITYWHSIKVYFQHKLLLSVGLRSFGRLTLFQSAYAPKYFQYLLDTNLFPVGKSGTFAPFTRHMLTRYQHKAMLYSQVLEEPNLMSNILKHLAPKDAVNLKRSHGNFTLSPRFDEVVGTYLLKEKQIYEEKLKKEKERLAFEKRKTAFTTKMRTHLYAIEGVQGTQNRKRLAIDMFDFLYESKDIIELPMFVNFRESVHNRLIVFLRDPLHNFDLVAPLSGSALRYRVQAQPVPYTGNSTWSTSST